MSGTPEAETHAKDNPFHALIAENRLLTGPGSAKETRHLVVDISASGLAYQAGDSLGIYPSNPPADIEEILGLLGASGDEPVSIPRAPASLPLRAALADKLSISGPTRRIVETLAGRASAPGEKARLAELLAPDAKEALQAFLHEREFADLLAEFPSARLEPQELVDHMRRLMPRLYSIASSPRVSPEQVHLTVAVVRYRTNNRDRGGVCTTFLADRVRTGVDRVPVFVASSHFRLPEDGATDAIMVGPGTGIAPFRAFVQERAAVGAKGRNWIVFGEQHRATDFLYEEEWSGHLAQGRVARVDTAFSRDQSAKVYVQDRLRENAAEVWSWIEKGANFYVCGDAKRMARDVDAALHDIVAGQGRLSPAQADDYVNQMRKARRYQKDVY
jgi:sulfite reductase (NADPH) flavoprotein alpha-component